MKLNLQLALTIWKTITIFSLLLSLFGSEFYLTLICTISAYAAGRCKSDLENGVEA